jgi:hypothetical protein
MDSSVTPKDEIWFLRVCNHISTGLYLSNKVHGIIFQKTVMFVVISDRTLERKHSNSVSADVGRNRMPVTLGRLDAFSLSRLRVSEKRRKSMKASTCPQAMLLYIRLRESVTCVNREREDRRACNMPAGEFCPRSDYSDTLAGQL